MFKWPETPSSHAERHELADYIELVCWKERAISRTALSKQLGRLEENDYSSGVPEDDSTDPVVDAAYAEIESRQETCGDGYPFAISQHGHTVSDNLDVNNHRHIVYQYLLLATRMNMGTDRVHAGIDGTSLFEELASEVAREYFGPRSNSFVFGTGSSRGDFVKKVNDLCLRMKEGFKFNPHSGTPPRVKDGKLDVVVWKGFADGSPGQLIGFGQCKTGTSYMDMLTHLQPDSFCDKWLLTKPAVLPVRMFWISEALSREGWYDTVRDAGLLFDRCRIVDFCNDICPRILGKVRIWTKAAAEAAELHIL